MQVVTKTSKPSKQRKKLFQAPDHIRYKHFAASLSPELRETYNTRSLPVRRGDIVRVMRGDHKGFEGRVSSVDRKKYRIYIEGLTREKVDGTTIFVPVHPSKVMITKLNLDDKWRRKILEERKKVKKAAAGAVEKIEEEVKKPVEVLKMEEKAVAVAEKPPPVEEEKPKKKKMAAKKTVKKVAEKTKPKTEAKAKTRRRKSSEESKVG